MLNFVSMLAFFASPSISHVLPLSPEASNKTLAARSHLSADCTADQDTALMRTLLGVTLVSEYASHAIEDWVPGYDSDSITQIFGPFDNEYEELHWRAVAAVTYRRIFREAQSSPWGRTMIYCQAPRWLCTVSDDRRAYTQPETNSIHLVVSPRLSARSEA
ncbi:MAG: hypothetical protein Q9160_008138 [Pyrenula sp. 1 TL-2023]